DAGKVASEVDVAGVVQRHRLCDVGKASADRAGKGHVAAAVELEQEDIEEILAAGGGKRPGAPAAAKGRGAAETAKQVDVPGRIDVHRVGVFAELGRIEDDALVAVLGARRIDCDVDEAVLAEVALIASEAPRPHEPAAGGVAGNEPVALAD